MDPGEWICLNCGNLVLEKPLDFSHLEQKPTKWDPDGTRRVKAPVLPSFEGIDEEEEVQPVRSVLL